MNLPALFRAVPRFIVFIAGSLNALTFLKGLECLTIVNWNPFGGIFQD